MTDENKIETSVDGDVLSIDEKIAALQAERVELKATQSEEIAEKQKAQFVEIVGSASEVLEATGIDLDALKAIGVTGFTVMVSPDPEGGPDVTSIAPVTAVKAKKAKASSTSGGAQRDLQGNFETHATAEEQTAMAALLSDGGDGNKVYALRLKVWKRVNEG